MGRKQSGFLGGNRKGTHTHTYFLILLVTSLFKIKIKKLALLHIKTPNSEKGNYLQNPPISSDFPEGSEALNNHKTVPGKLLGGDINLLYGLLVFLYL